MPGDVAALPVAGGKEHEDGGEDAGDHAQADEGAAVLLVAAGEQIERAHRGHRDAGRHHRAGHGVDVLPAEPRIQQQAPEAGEDHLAMGADGVAGRMLHPGIGGNDEES